jgi:hypothetical protein
MYFDACNPPGVGAQCLDGGLQANNPIQLALKESRKLWGEETPLDIILSIGTGKAKEAQSGPSILWVIPRWVRNLFQNFLETMNGEKIWQDFWKNAPSIIKDRARRLNPELNGDKEPGLDDVEQISPLANLAREYEFLSSEKYEKDTIRRMVANPTSDSIQEIALCLRASLFYLNLEQIRYSNQDRVTIFIGTIHCRLDANSDSFQQLVAKTMGFKVGNCFKPTENMDTREPFRVAVNIQMDSMALDEIVDIEVKFEEGILVPIAGFPCKMAVSNLFPRRFWYLRQCAANKSLRV